MFHGSDKDIDITQDNPHAGRQDLCLTDDEDIAAEYGDVIHELDVDTGIGGSLNIADEEEARAIVCDVYGIDSLDLWLFEALDDPEVMEAIVEAGFHGVDFVDQSPESFCEHDTLRLYSYDVDGDTIVAPN